MICGCVLSQGVNMEGSCHKSDQWKMGLEFPLKGTNNNTGTEAHWKQGGHTHSKKNLIWVEKPPFSLPRVNRLPTIHHYQGSHLACETKGGLREISTYFNRLNAGVGADLNHQGLSVRTAQLFFFSCIKRLAKHDNMQNGAQGHFLWCATFPHMISCTFPLCC